MARRLSRSKQTQKDFNKMANTVGKILRGGKRRRKKSKMEKLLDFLTK